MMMMVIPGGFALSVCTIMQKVYIRAASKQSNIQIENVYSKWPNRSLGR